MTISVAMKSSPKPQKNRACWRPPFATFSTLACESAVRRK